MFTALETVLTLLFSEVSRPPYSVNSSNGQQTEFTFFLHGVGLALGFYPIAKAVKHVPFESKSLQALWPPGQHSRTRGTCLPAFILWINCWAPERSQSNGVFPSPLLRITPVLTVLGKGNRICSCQIPTVTSQYSLDVIIRRA